MRALVLGASSGVGAALTEALAERGDHVVAAARRTDLLAELEARHPELEARHPDLVRTQRLDLLETATVEEGVRRAAATLGGLDALVVTAGLPTLDLLDRTTPQMWHDLVTVNLVGPGLAATEAARLLGRGGRVVLVSSASAHGGWPELVPYAAAKAGLEVLAEGLQRESPHLNVTTVVMGPAATGAHDSWGHEHLRTAYRAWRSGGFLEGPQQMSAREVADTIADVLRRPVRVPRIELLPDYTVVPE